MSAIDEEVDVPEILRMGRRGVNIKVWTFLHLNMDRWFTAREISEYLELPLSTVQLALRQVHRIAPRVHCEDINVDHRGRREKRYVFRD